MKERFFKPLIPLQVADGFDDGVAQVIDIVGHEVGKRRTLGVAPDGLDRIQVGGVSRQPFHFEPAGTRCVQLSYGRAMHIQAIHDDQEWPAQLPMQLAQIGDALRRADVVIVNLERDADPPPLRRKAQTADHRETIMSLRGVLHGPHSLRRPGATIQWSQEKAGFIEKDDASFAPASLFLIRGQSS